MQNTRTIEIFSAGCQVCDETIALVNDLACPSCDVKVLDMQDAVIASRAKQLGIRSIPAGVIDGQLADCCAGRGPSVDTLRSAGVGTPLP